MVFFTTQGRTQISPTTLAKWASEAIGDSIEGFQLSASTRVSRLLRPPTESAARSGGISTRLAAGWSAASQRTSAGHGLDTEPRSKQRLAWRRSRQDSRRAVGGNRPQRHDGRRRRRDTGDHRCTHLHHSWSRPYRAGRESEGRQSARRGEQSPSIPTHEVLRFRAQARPATRCALRSCTTGFGRNALLVHDDSLECVSGQLLKKLPHPLGRRCLRKPDMTPRESSEHEQPDGTDPAGGCGRSRRPR